jgi:hypothetical protein
MEALLAVRHELDQLDAAIKAETGACAAARKAGAAARAEGERLRAALAAATQDAFGAEERRSDLASLLECLEAQKEGRARRRAAAEVGASAPPPPPSGRHACRCARRVAHSLAHARMPIPHT